MRLRRRAGFANSANDLGTLHFSYATTEDPGSTITDSVSTIVNDVPGCGTADGGVNPKDWPHEPDGDPEVRRPTLRADGHPVVND